VGAVGRRGDRRRAQRPDLWLANSRAVADRILHIYGQPATVVHPPVDIDRFAAAATTTKGDYFLVVSRLVPYKRVDLAVAAFAELGWPLRIAGSGRGAAALQATAPPNVRFLGRVDDAELPALMAGARALVFPAEEDFGLVPVEAMAAGTPVVAFGAGGALDTVEPGQTGTFFTEPTTAALVAAVREAAATEWDAQAISASVRRFGEDRFRTELLDAAASLRRP
jgi:glycosyltransferase involved in cell wall biosynthesis